MKTTLDSQDLAPTHVQVDELAEAMCQLLDDMGDGLSVCLYAKAQARVAYEPFLDMDAPPKMSLEEAKQILAEPAL